MSEQGDFAILQKQPDFPNEDLHETNVDLVSYYLTDVHPDAPHAETLKQSLRMIHITGDCALRTCGVETRYSEAEYHAFCRGFAAFECMSLLVNPRPYNGTLAVRNTHDLLVEPGEMADIEMSERHKVWPDMYPNAYDVIVKAGDHYDETMKQLHARTIGAQIACELQLTA